MDHSKMDKLVFGNFLNTLEENEETLQEIFAQISTSSDSEIVNDVRGTSDNGEPSTPLTSNYNTVTQNPMMQRLFRDLNSPSAASRVRAIRGLKSESKRNYNQFDVPYEEIDIITAEERAGNIPKAKADQEILKEIRVFVEVRTNEDNRTAGIQKVVAGLGARVHERISKTTTHVIFKDGQRSNYIKAKNMNIPIVSVRWVDACKKYMQIVDPSLYPISNIECYANPELYKQKRRQKSMQPGAVDKIRVNRKKAQTPEAKNLSSPPRLITKKNDGFDKMLINFQNQLLSTPDSEINSRPLQLLEKIRNSPAPYRKTLLEKEPFSNSSQTKILTETSSSEGSDLMATTPLDNNNSTKKTLIISSKQQAYTPTSTFRRVTRRSSLLLQQSLQLSESTTSTESIHAVTKQASKLSVTDEDTNREEAKIQVKSKPVHRRRTMFTPRVSEKIEEEEDLSISKGKRSTEKVTSVNVGQITRPSKHNEIKKPMHLQGINIQSPTPISSNKKDNRMQVDNIFLASSRKTIFSPEAMDQSTRTSLKGILVQSTGKRNDRRGTLFTPQPMDQTICYTNPVNINKSHDRRKTVHFTPREKEGLNKENAVGFTNTSQPRRIGYGSQLDLSSASSDGITVSTLINSSPNMQRKKTDHELNMSKPNTNIMSWVTNTTKAKSGRTTGEEYDYNQGNLFDSTRMPDQNKSIQEKSQAVFEKRIGDINTKNKRMSLSLAATAACNTPKAITVDEVLKLNNKNNSNNQQNRQTQTPLQKNQVTMNLFFKSQKKSNYFPVKAHPNVNSSDSEFDAPVAVVRIPASKKRKLYDDPISHSQDDLVLPNTVSNKSVTNKDTINKGTTNKSTINKGTIYKKKTNKGTKDASNKGAIKKTPVYKNVRKSSIDDSSSDSDFVRETHKIPVAPFVDRKGNTIGPVVPRPPNWDKPGKADPVVEIAFTQLTKEQEAYVEEATKILGGELYGEVTNNTSHLITGGPELSFRMLHAITWGSYIVTLTWVEKSLETGYWMYERPYELFISNAVRFRSEEPHGMRSKMFYQKFYVCSDYKKKVALEKVIEMTGGKLVPSISEAEIVVAKKYPKVSLQKDVLVVISKYVFDVIIHQNFTPNLAEYRLNKPKPTRNNPQ